ncbi:MAG: hypothetical protein RLZZ60_340 [Bacteroidota bacterium]|jgi:uncharacterized protein (TIGR00266 family)
MQIDIQLGPGNSVAKIQMAPNEAITAEGGAMIAMSNDMDIQTTTYKKNSGGIMKGLKRMISGESFFINHYTAGPNGGELYLAPGLHGDMFTYELNNTSLIVQSGSYLASEPGVEIDFNWQGLKSIFSGEGLFWLNLNGQGKVVVNSYGAIYPVEVDGDYIVDTGHIVAFEPSLSFSISKVGRNWLSSFLGGEGFVCRFKGKGTVWCQSHNQKNFGTSIGPKLKPR